MAGNQPPKKDVALALLENGSVFVHLDPRREGVVVPDAFRHQPELVLQFGLNMRVPIKDLEVDDEAISGTLSFARRPFWCRIPWSSVFAMVADDRRGVAWPEDAPQEGRASARPSKGPPASKRPHLRAVGPDERPDAAADGAATESDATCALCSTKWVEDASSCPVCGASREEGLRSGGAPAADAPEPASVEVAGGAGAPSAPPPEEPPPDAPPPDAPPPDAPPPDAPPPKRPHLRLVKG